MTTTVGIIFKNGVILAADSQATLGHIISEKETIKIEKIYDNIYAAIAGGVADNQYLIKIINANLEMLKLKVNAKIKVKDVANLISLVLFRNKGLLNSWPIIAGYDDKPRLFNFDCVGSLIEIKDYTCSGSGMVFAYGVLESSYKENLSEKEAKELAIKAINAARERDIYSGGKFIKMVIIKQDQVIEETVQ